jgi:hypothetical protein
MAAACPFGFLRLRFPGNGCSFARFSGPSGTLFCSHRLQRTFPADASAPCTLFSKELENIGWELISHGPS